MGLQLDIELKGDKTLRSRLEALLKGKGTQFQFDTISDIMEESIMIAKEYPSETEANRPPPPYYQRGRGMIGRGGTVVRGKESEQLKSRWKSSITIAGNRAVGTIRNTASYSSYVQGELQAPFHAAREWQTIENIAATVSGDREAAQAATTNIRTRGIDYLNQWATKIANFIRGT